MREGNAAMTRIREYIGFAIWFAGLGYLVLWPVASPDANGQPFGASLLCHDGAFGALNLLCNTARPLRLPPSLHVLGVLSALVVALRLLAFVFKRSRRDVVTPKVDISALLARLPPATSAPRPRKPAAPLYPAKSRTQFGLRGVPR